MPKNSSRKPSQRGSSSKAPFQKNSNKGKDKKSPFHRTKLLCKFCKAVFDGKHWLPFSKLDPTIIDELKINICPACHEKMDHISDGVLHLSGNAVSAHKEEIKNLLMNAAAREEERDILNRIERIEDNGSEMIIYTGKNQLAVELGKKVANAYKGGKLEIKWSKGDKPVEVWWNAPKK